MKRQPKSILIFSGKRQARARGWAYFQFGLLLCVIALTGYSRNPEISIGGLPGAEHWVWLEGVDFAEGRGGRNFRDNHELSGWIEGGPPNTYDRTTGSYDVGQVKWKFAAPAEMWNKTKLYLRAMINRPAVAIEVVMGRDIVSSEDTKLLTSSLAHPMTFLDWEVGGNPVGSGLPIGPVDEGEQSIALIAEPKSEQGFTSFVINGLLLYDGDPELRSTAEVRNGRLWLQNPGSKSSPVLNQVVTPTITVSGTDDTHEVQYLLDGKPYVPGTPINAGENYELVVAVYQGAENNGQRVAFAGANFSVKPEGSK